VQQLLRRTFQRQRFEGRVAVALHSGFSGPCAENYIQQLLFLHPFALKAKTTNSASKAVR
jgi:hypothetical protein